MTQPKYQGWWLLWITFLVALVLAIAPLPLTVRSFLPDWYALFLIYWCLAPAHRVGIGVGWCLGLILDVLQGGLLGQNAFALSLVAFLCLRLRARMLAYALWQQMVVVMTLLFILRLCAFWIAGILGHPLMMEWTYWMPVLLGTLLWPCLWFCLRALQVGRWTT